MKQRERVAFLWNTVYSLCERGPCIDEVHL